MLESNENRRFAWYRSTGALFAETQDDHGKRAWRYCCHNGKLGGLRYILTGTPVMYYGHVEIDLSNPDGDDKLERLISEHGECLLYRHSFAPGWHAPMGPAPTMFRPSARQKAKSAKLAPIAREQFERECMEKLNRTLTARFKNLGEIQAAKLIDHATRTERLEKPEFSNYGVW